MSNTEQTEGWGFPTLSRKAHYFVDTMSLCRKYGFYRGPLEQGNDDSPDNCAVCMKRLAKREMAAAATDREPEETR